MQTQLRDKGMHAASRPKFSCSSLRTPLVSEIGDSLLKSKNGIQRRTTGEAPRILLFVPPYTRLIEPAPDDSPLRAIGIENEEIMKRAGTPIGLVRIATQAKRAGYEIKIVDAPFEGWDQEEPLLYLPNGGKLLRYGLTDALIRKMIEKFQPDIVGIQCNYTVQWGNARALADLVKSIDKGIVVIGGGAHTSGDWKNALADSPIDIICINESDRSFTKILNALTNNEVSVSKVMGLAYRKNGELVRTSTNSYISIRPSRPLSDKLDVFPLPDFGLLNVDLYSSPYHSAGARMRSNGAWAQIFSTIGCNVGCDFCYIPMINGPWRALGTDWFDQHLSDLKKHGVTEVLLEDDHLLHDPLYALQVFEVLKKQDLPWVEEGGLSLFNLILLHKGKEFLATLSEAEQRSQIYKNVIRSLEAGINAKSFIKSMAESGCYSVYLAVESANEESLGNSNKPTINVMQQATMEIVSIFAEVGIKVTGGFMLGFVNPPKQPGDNTYIESVDQIRRTIDYAIKLIGSGMEYANPFIVTPLPGTRMWEFQQRFVVRDYDTGWSHERATMATDNWSADDLETLRWELMIRANGIEKTRQMLSRGTWPV